MAMVRTDEVARGEDELVVEHPLRLHIEVARRVQRDHLRVDPWLAPFLHTC